jgi:IS5 family transposase
MPKLIERLLKRSNKNKNFHIKSVLADGAYDSNNNFKHLEKKKIQPGIKVRKNSIIARKNNILRNIEVNSQITDLLKWKKSRKYGSRWIADETVFSSIKRMFGEHTLAIRFQVW